MGFIYFGTPCTVTWPRIVSLARLHDKDLRSQQRTTSACIFLLFYYRYLSILIFRSATIKSFIFLGMHKT